jgi:hypothetical protein
MSPFSFRLPSLSPAAFALIGLVVLSAPSAMAQEREDGGFLGNGLKGLFGGGSGDRPSGAYVSPDSIPSGDELPRSGLRALEKLDPIALPDLPGSLSDPVVDLPRLPAYAPQPLPSIDLLRGRKTLVLEAKLTADGEAVPSGLIWRLFSPIPALDGKLPLVASARGGTASFEVPPGAYLLHVGFGRAGITKRVDFDGRQTREIVILDAGGLKLNAVAADDVPIPAEALTFDIFSDAPEERDRQLIADDIAPNKVVQLNAGTYHVVSNFGSVNAVVKADVKVEPGKITDVTLEQRGAQLTMKLVREKGGEAIADTAWSISNVSGDVIRESVGAFPSMVLAEGDYTIVAKNKDRLYQRDFTVEAGVNTDVEVLTSDLLAAPGTSEGSGD